MAFEQDLDEILRGTLDVINKEDLVKKLKLNRPLNIKFGVDPTAPDIHLGHTVPLQKLRQFQERGHNIQLVIGDYTAIIGDPSGKSETRKMLSREEIAFNMKTYTDQVFKVIDKSKTNLLYNSDWLNPFSGLDMINLGSKYSVQQLLQRRDFADRIKNNKPLSVTELIYPLLVGYDSVHLKSDIELGGTDQLFNFMASREIQKAYGQEPEVILTLPLLEGTDGVRKMSKSLGNAIGVKDFPSEMYGKIMSIPDSVLWKYFELLSDKPLSEIALFKKSACEGQNPMEYKRLLARELVGRYYDSSLALSAEDSFDVKYRGKKPSSLNSLEHLSFDFNKNEDLNIVYVLKKLNLVSSNGEARRLIEQKAISIDQHPVLDYQYSFSPSEAKLLKVGKRFYGYLDFNLLK
jgi:tyrosyl-tRNA synthetase